MKDLNKAIDEISTIRSQIVLSHTFRGFSALVIAGTGVLAAFILILQTFGPISFAQNNTDIIILWICAAIFSVACIGAEMVVRSRRHHGGLSNSMLTKAVENFIPIGITGAVLGFVVLKFSEQTSWILPGIWQMLISVAVFSALRFLPRSVIIVAVWYLLSGAVTLLIGAINQSLSPWMMGVPFIVGQFLMAAVLYYSSEKK